MRNTFSWRHATAIAALVCLVSLVTGAVMAQSEPDLPDPEVPVFDLTGSVAQPASEPALPAEVNPFVIVEPSGQLVANSLSPKDISTSINPTYTWSVPTPIADTTSFDFELFAVENLSSPEPLTGTPLYSTIDASSPISTSVCNTTTGICSLPLTGTNTTLQDGRAYFWKVISNGSSTNSASATFVVDVPRTYPASNEQIINTTPWITFPQVQGAQTYELASYALPSTFDPTGAIPWVETYYAVTTTVGGETKPGICSNGQCRVKPNVDLTFGVEGQGNTPVQIWYRTAHPITGQSEWQTLLGNPNLTFTILAPRVSADVAGGTPGRPKFSVLRDLAIEEDAQGLTFTTAPDYYRLFAYIPSTGGWVDEWYKVANCLDTITACDLVPFDGVQDIMYDNSYILYARGYNSRTQGYTPWTNGNTNFLVNENPPAISNLALAGLYDRVGSGINPDPNALFSDWVACPEVSSQKECVSSRPILHIQPNIAEASAEWVNVILYDPVNNIIPFNNWFNIYDAPTTNPDDPFWGCYDQAGLGGMTTTYQFNTRTCFFQPGLLPEDGSLAKGINYDWYVRTWGAGGGSTGGISGYSLPGGEGDPNNIASFRVKGNVAPTGMGEILVGTNGVAGVTSTNITGEVKFVWDHVPSATWYNLIVKYGFNPGNTALSNTEIYNNWFPVGSGPNAIQCVSGVCGFTPPPGSDFYLMNGSYSWELIYWDGGMSEPGSHSFTVTVGAPVQITAAPTMQAYVNESLTGTVTPRFRWQHQQNNTWYNLQLNPGTAKAYDQWYRAYDVCGPDFSGEIFCDVSLNVVGNSVLGSGQHSWHVDAWGPANTIVTGEAATFELSSLATGKPVQLYPVSLTHTISGRNTLELYFTPAPNASWYQIFVGQPQPDTTYTVDYLEWHYLPNYFTYTALALDRCGDDMTYGALTHTKSNLCRIIPSEVENGISYPFEFWKGGDFEWWIQPYGPSGFNNDALQGWTGGAAFELDLDKATAVDQTTLRNQDGVLLTPDTVVAELTGFKWERTAVAEWYNLRVWDDATNELVYDDWRSREQSGCSPRGGGTTCSLELNQLISSIPSGTYGTLRARIAVWSMLNGIPPTYEELIDDLSVPPADEPQYATFIKL